MFSPSANKIFWVQLICWLSIPLLWGFAGVEWFLLSLFMYVLYAGAGVALTFHRILSHRSFTVKPFVRKCLIILASYANVGSALTWVSVHRAHHRYCDTVKDPHSPSNHGFLYMMFGTMFAKVSVKHAIDLLRDPWVTTVHRYYYAIQIPWIVFLFLVGGWQAVLACHLVPGGLTWLGGSFVNYLNHKAGYINTPTKDTSKNNFVTGFLVLGEGWHNNHHANPLKASTSEKWWEFDLVYYLGCLVGAPRK